MLILFILEIMKLLKLKNNKNLSFLKHILFNIIVDKHLIINYIFCEVCKLTWNLTKLLSLPIYYNLQVYLLEKEWKPFKDPTLLALIILV